MRKLSEFLGTALAERQIEEELKRMVIGMCLEKAGGVLQFEFSEAEKLEGGFVMECDGNKITVTAVQDSEISGS
jgi:hypothetical protein